MFANVPSQQPYGHIAEAAHHSNINNKGQQTGYI
jgi:hypothetical protein